MFRYLTLYEHRDTLERLCNVDKKPKEKSKEKDKKKEREEKDAREREEASRKLRQDRVYFVLVDRAGLIRWLIIFSHVTQCPLLIVVLLEYLK